MPRSVRVCDGSTWKFIIVVRGFGAAQAAAQAAATRRVRGETALRIWPSPKVAISIKDNNPIRKSCPTCGVNREAFNVDPEAVDERQKHGRRLMR